MLFNMMMECIGGSLGMITVDKRFLDTEEDFEKYCKDNGIKNPFKEKEKIHNSDKLWSFSYEKDKLKLKEKKQEKDKYLRLKDNYRLWSFHYWMDNWDDFQWFGRRCDTLDAYVPCDLASRQCSMACKYFGGNCLREREELKCPILEEK